MNGPSSGAACRAFNLARAASPIGIRCSKLPASPGAPERNERAAARRLVDVALQAGAADPHDTPPFAHARAAATTLIDAATTGTGG